MYISHILGSYSEPEYFDQVNTYSSKDYVPIYQVNNNANFKGKRGNVRNSNVIKRRYKDSYGYKGGDGYGEGMDHPFFDSEMDTCLSSDSVTGRDKGHQSAIVGILNGCISIPVGRR